VRSHAWLPRTLVFLWAVALGSGCSPVLTRRHATLTAPVLNSELKVSATAFPIEPSAPRTVFDLAPDGQAAMVTALAAKVDSPAALQAALAAPIQRSGGSGVQDLTTQSRRIVLSIDGEHQGLADRLTRCRTEFNLLATSLGRFKSWNQLSTRFDTIDLGKIGVTQKGSLSAGLESLAPGSSEISKATLGASTERGMTEEVVLRQRYVSSSGTLTPLQASILQQGAVGLDLMGNVIFDVVIAAAKAQLHQLYRPDGLFAASGQPLPAETVRLVRRLVRVPSNADQDITAKLKASCTVRTVAKGADTFTESDDVASLSDLPDEAEVVLVTAEEQRVSQWYLQDRSGHILSIEEPDGDTVLAFDSYDGARDFLLWLRASNATHVAGRKIGLGEKGKLQATPDPPRWNDLSVRISGLNWAIPALSPALTPSP
jgi:hypothetical protein